MTTKARIVRFYLVDFILDFILILAFVAIAMIACADAGAAPLADYFFNWAVYGHSIASMMGCWVIGGWGILFDDDDGQMINDCNNLFSGSQVTFPVEYAQPE